ncbi:MAG: hypothetical protein SVO26_05865 [Chloroflexota bacterium]|nr:hypothetical protein [Chloroflexota bacterium]
MIKKAHRAQNTKNRPCAILATPLTPWCQAMETVPAYDHTWSCSVTGTTLTAYSSDEKGGLGALFGRYLKLERSATILSRVLEVPRGR